MARNDGSEGVPARGDDSYADECPDTPSGPHHPPAGVGRPFVFTPGLEETNPGRGPLGNAGRPPPLSPEVRQERAKGRDRGILNDPLGNDGRDDAQEG
jgi:hypothetical protein